MHRLTRLTTLAACLAAAAAVLSWSPASAQAATCGDSQPFAPWGDSATYVPMVNGGLEGGSTGWTLAGGAAVVSANEPYHIGSASDSQALALPAGSSATAHATCIGMLYPMFRVFVQNTGASSATLRVDVTYRDLFGISHREVLGYVSGRSSWTLSPRMTLLDPASLVATQTNGQTWLTFVPEGASGSWRIDDVYVDPYKMK